MFARYCRRAHKQDRAYGCRVENAQGATHGAPRREQGIGCARSPEGLQDRGGAQGPSGTVVKCRRERASSSENDGASGEKGALSSERGEFGSNDFESLWGRFLS